MIRKLWPHSAASRSMVVASLAATCLIFVVPAASASTHAATARLKIDPSEIYYPCNEGDVTFTVSGFAASSTVSLEIGSATAVPAATIDTNTSGSGSVTLSFSGYYPGDYAFYATQSSLKVVKKLTVGECP